MKMDEVLELILFPDEIDVGQLVFINVQNSEYGLVSSIDWNYNVAKVKVRDGTEAPYPTRLLIPVSFKKSNLKLVKG